MDVQFEQQFTGAPVAHSRHEPRRLERSILIYWALALIVGAVALPDLLTSWNIGATLTRPGLVIYLLVTFAISQILYIIVARHDGRPIHWGATAIFALGNGICETLAFILTYRLGEVIGQFLGGLVAPAAASVAGFALGLICFIIYGGLIHAIFWLPLLPPHFDNSPRSRAIRKVRPLFEVALVVGWSLCIWLTRDIWMVVFLHILVDVGLMLRVRPALFIRFRRAD